MKIVKFITKNENISSRFPIGLLVLIQYVKNAFKNKDQNPKEKKVDDDKMVNKPKSSTIEEIVDDLETITAYNCDLTSILKINIIEK